jgi:transposase
MPELGALEHKCAASLAGLAPVARDSGRHRGQRCIRGGRAPLRQALYLPALVAVRFDAALKARYQALRAAGKPPKVALVAIMRKLLILANALIRDGRTWTPYTYLAITDTLTPRSWRRPGAARRETAILGVPRRSGSVRQHTPAIRP